MRRVIITTAGTSLLTSWERMNGSLGPAPDKQTLFAAWKEQQLNCAELASLSRLELDPRYDYLYLISSDTEHGILCLETIVETLLEQGFVYTEAVIVKGLTKNYHEFETRGLPNLLEQLAEIKEKHAGAATVINATGGFKALTSYATFFGIITGAEVVYMHEDFSSLLTYPPMPVGCDVNFIMQYKDRFGEIIAAESKKEARQRIDELPIELRGFFKKDKDRYAYSPIGRFFISHLERLTTRNHYTVRTNKNHTSLWGDGIQELDRIEDAQVRGLFMKIFDTVPYVTSIFLDEMVHRSRDEIYMEYVETQNQALRYMVYTPTGSEYVKVEVLPGMERETLRLLGRKIYP
jgi:putative CRISPR-associated protein (TIGR02619 family)